MGDTGRSWPVDNSEALYGGGVPYVYAVAFRWTLAQITLGGIDIVPANSYERFYCICLMVFGLLFSSVVVSVISSQALEYVAAKREMVEKTTAMQQFLKQNTIEETLAQRVQRQIRKRLASNVLPLSEQDVPAIAMLSSTLRSELLLKTRLPH